MTQTGKQRVREILQAAGSRRIAVLGDVMLDEFVWGEVTRISPEAPVPVVDIRRESVHLGGAANVLANLLDLGAKATVIGVSGNDHAGDRLRIALRDLGRSDSDDFICVDKARTSTIKTRIIAHSQLVVRADRETKIPVNGDTEDRIISRLKEVLPESDAFVVSDYDKGVVTRRILEEVLPIAYERVPVLIDPKLRNFNSYRPATVVTPNHHEALRMTNLEDHSDDSLYEAAKAIHARLGCDSVLITRGDQGMMLLEGDGDPIFIGTTAREVYDVTGAGDTVIATLGAALAAGATIFEATDLANHAAGIVVGKIGTATATAEELLASFT